MSHMQKQPKPLVLGAPPLVLFCSLFCKGKGEQSLAVNQDASLTLTCISIGHCSRGGRLKQRNKISDFIRVYYLEGFLSISCCCPSHRIRCGFPFAGIYSKYASRLSAFFSSQKQREPFERSSACPIIAFPCTVQHYNILTV